MRASRTLLAALAAALAACPAAGPAQEPAPASERLFVELAVNGVTRGELVEVERAGNRLWVAARALRDAGLAAPGDARVDVSALAGVRAGYDAAEQRLSLDADAALLPVSRIAAPARERPATVADTGAVVNYDLFAQGGTASSVALWSEQRLFGRFGSFSTSGALRTRRGGEAGPAYLRYDTSYRWADEDRAATATLGDLVTHALPWTGAVRMGGVRLSRDFRVRPDLVTAPLPSFAGEVGLPSAVDVFVDGYRRQQTRVAPGRFVLDDMPVVSGAGVARIVTTDAVGRQVATVIPFYVAPELLRPGLADFSAELGFLRLGYGLRNFDYGALAASFSVRRGVTPKLTLEGHGELRRGLAAGGAGFVWAPGLWGALHGSALLSSAGRGGRQITVGYTYSGGRLGLSVEHVERSPGFRDLGGFDLDVAAAGARNDRVTASFSADRWGSFGFGYIDGRSRAGRARLLSASWSAPVRRGLSVFASLDYDAGRRTASGQIRLAMPFGRSSVSAGLSHDRVRGFTGSAEYGRPAPTGGGWGLSAGAGMDEGGDAYGQGTATWRFRQAQLQAGGSFAAGRGAAWAGATGSLVLLDGRVFAANQTSDAFAVVSTGVAGVPIAYENQPIGRTGRTGRLFVPRVTAYHPGRFSLDPLALEAGLAPTLVETRPAVRGGMGAVIRMPIRRARSAVVSLVDANGAALTPGGAAVLPDGRRLVVGWDGVVFMDGMSETVELDVLTREGARCRARLAWPADAPAFAQLGSVPCR